jgi:hypothetical protein
MMRISLKGILAILAVLFVVVFVLGYNAHAQGNAGTIQGTVKDSTGAVVPGAKVEITNPVSKFHQETTSSGSGDYRFSNVPFNPYHMVVTAKGFAPFTQDVEVRSGVPVTADAALNVGTTTTVTVEAGATDLIETESTFHTDIDKNLFDKMPLESASSSVSALVTQSSPGVAADSNGLFHGLGDHAENSFSVDGQPITDQQSKVFSNQIPLDSIQSLEVISGAPPAEYGDKTSLVIKVTTQSGLGVTTPHGALTASYGSFGSTTTGLNLAYGNQKWGNFISLSGLNTSRFLDPPEFAVLHDKGNEENAFDRVDYQMSQSDSFHMNIGFTRSWFQNPNTFDQQLHTCNAGFTCNAAGQAINPLNGALLGPTDQHSQILTFNIAPTFTHLIGSDAVFTFGGFLRHDQFNYYPSADPFADFSPDLQSQTIRQDRRLTNAGLKSDISYVKGINNIKAGIVYQDTLLREADQLGTVDPGFLALFNQFDPATGTFTPGTSCLDPVTGNPISDPCTTLAPSDLTRGGSVFGFRGRTNIQELSTYIQDTITKGPWSFNLGLRGDFYNGLASKNEAEPRIGIAYNIKPTNTVLRLSYARTLETPFNENLIIASQGCNNPVIAFLVPPANIPCAGGAVSPGVRNEFHAGLQQAFGKYLVIDGEYIWKYTRNAYDFGVVASTPIAFPIEWTKSKIPGYAIRANVPNFHGFTALVVMSSVAARFFPPQVAAIPFLPAPAVFRIDHDEKFNSTMHLQYQPKKTWPWLAFNWRYDNGLVAGSVPCSAPTATCSFSTSVADGGAAPIPSGQVALVNNITGLPLTGDQEFQAGITCDGKLAAPTPTSPALATCDAAGLGSIFIKIPNVGTENDDHNPQRIAPRHLFDASLGDDNLFHGDRYKWSARVTVINLTNKVALYNFFSTFSGTHYVTPRTYTAELGFHF